MERHDDGMAATESLTAHERQWRRPFDQEEQEVIAQMLAIIGTDPEPPQPVSA